MKGFNPNQPTGSDPEAKFAQSTHEKLHGTSSRFNNSSTVKVKRTSRGYSWHAQRSKGGVSSSIKQVTLISVFGDYLECEDAAGKTYYVAKPLKLRTSITSEVLGGTTISYTITSDTTRRANFTISGQSAATEDQVYVPRYLPAVDNGYKGDVITIQSLPQVLNADGSTVQDADQKDVVWLDMNTDARAWST